MEKTSWYVYIIETEKGFYYTGITNDMLRRFKQHSGIKKGGKGAKFFNFDCPKRVVYIERVRDRSEAAKKEVFIKKMTKLKKRALVAVFLKRTENIKKAIGFNSLMDKIDKQS
ncbi:MAG: endonuclease [Halobacteriovoraceae bacterium]|nr:endonuclease [Halobacteriovoraceae bacterium]